MSHLLNRVAEEQVKQGMNTGAASRIFSYLGLFPLTFLVSHFVNTEEYWISGLILTVGFTRFGFIVTIFILIFSIINEDWVVLSAIILFGSFGTISALLGTSNAKKIILNQKVNVDPLEGMFDFTIAIVVQLIAFGAALIFSGIYSILLWILLGLSSFWAIGRIWFRLYPKWSRLYHSIMMRFSSYTGAEGANSENENREYDIEKVLMNLTEDIYPNMGEDDKTLILNTALSRYSTYADREQLNKMIEEEFKLTPERISVIQEQVETQIQNENNKNALLVKYLIGEIIENEFGAEERLKYIYTFQMGRLV